jgi:hypothetical protein
LGLKKERRERERESEGAVIAGVLEERERFGGAL